jgi:hypothetical protein
MKNVSTPLKINATRFIFHVTFDRSEIESLIGDYYPFQKKRWVKIMTVTLARKQLVRSDFHHRVVNTGARMNM